MASVLISTWGHPKGWKDVTYVMDGKRYDTQTKSSLPALLKYVDPKPEKVLLIVLDTVVKEPVSSYDDLIKSVKTYYQEFLKSLNLDLKSLNLDDPIVAPGVGKFQLKDGSYVEFQGSLTDYPAYVAFEISRRLLEVGGNELTVHLDLTHGINFMPSLTYAVVCEILGAISIAKKVYLKVYNSEPYGEGVRELNIHRVEDKEFHPNIRSEALLKDPHTEMCKLLEPRIVEEKKKDVGQSGLYCLDKNFVDELNAFLSSLVNGLPLAYYTFYPDDVLLWHRLEEAVKRWRSEIKISTEDFDFNVDFVSTSPSHPIQTEAKVPAARRRMLVNRAAKFGSEFVKCIIIWTAAKSLGGSRKEEVSREELEGLRKRVFAKWPKLSSMINYDLDEIEKNVINYKGRLDDWRPLREISGEGPSRGYRLIRNYLAHSGLESTLTLVKVRGDQIFLRYDKNARKDIIQACRKGLRPNNQQLE